MIESSNVSGVVTFLFTDVEGSSRLWEREPERMMRTMAAHDALLRAAVEENRGVVVKMTGDGLHAAFPDPLDATQAALAAQLALVDADRTHGIALRVRCGLHSGVVERRDNDYFGVAVNRAARIMSVAHGGQVLLSQAVFELIRGRIPPPLDLVDLGVVRLRDQAQPEHVHQLAHPLLRREFPPLRSAEATTGNLPRQATSFVGRETELDQLRELLQKYRLVTLVGPGGIGKTRLALKLGDDVAPGFLDGVWFADLAPLAAGGAVAEAVSAALHIAPGSHTSAAAITAYLEPQQVVLILDNCEHVLAEAAQLAAAILKQCPSVAIVASSREPLGLRGEYVYRMSPLSYPEAPAGLTAAEALHYGAVRLFAERAETALGGFALTDENAPVVAEICKRLVGIALAIELAVPRLKILQPEELRARLDDRFRLLTGGDRSALPRQQTLEAAIDWSYRLLTDAEKCLLRRLTIFAGSFTLDSASRVAGVDPLRDADVLDLVAALCDKSLVTPIVGSGGPSRYRLLETTREFALVRLVESGESGGQQRLARYLIELLAEAQKSWDTTPDAEWYRRYEPEIENLRAVLAWAFGDHGEPALGVELVADTVQLVRWWQRSERQRWFERAAGYLTAETPPSILGRIKLGLASSAGAHYGQMQGLDDALEAAAVFRRLDDPRNGAWAMTMAAESLTNPEHLVEAETYFREAEGLLRPLGATKQLAAVLIGKAVARGIVAGDIPAARELLDESAALAGHLGYGRLNESRAILRAEIEAADEKFDAAIATAREAEVALRRSGNTRLLYIVLGNLTGYQLARGDLAAALASGREGLRLARAHADDFLIHVLVEHLALAAALGGDAARAAGLAGFGASLYQQEKRAREPNERRTWNTLMSRLDAALPSEEKVRLMDEGARWSQERALREALALPRQTLAPSLEH